MQRPDPVDARDQGLANDRFENHAELSPDMVLLGGRKQVNDSIHGRSRGVGVKSGQGKMPGFGDPQGRFDRLRVAHFADQNNVRILPESHSERRREGVRVTAYLALVDDAALVTVQEFDGVFNGQDVPKALPVNLVDHGRKRRRLSAAGWTCYKNETARSIA